MTRFALVCRSTTQWSILLYTMLHPNVQCDERRWRTPDTVNDFSRDCNDNATCC